jgi:transposase
MFKKRVVTEVSQPGVTATQIARRYGLDARRVSNWINKFNLLGVTVRCLKCYGRSWPAALSKK